MASKRGRSKKKKVAKKKRPAAKKNKRSTKKRSASLKKRASKKRVSATKKKTAKRTKRPTAKGKRVKSFFVKPPADVETGPVVLVAKDTQLKISSDGRWAHKDFIRNLADHTTHRIRVSIEFKDANDFDVVKPLELRAVTIKPHRDDHGTGAGRNPDFKDFFKDVKNAAKQEFRVRI
jgi:hypothetical protein